VWPFLVGGVLVLLGVVWGAIVLTGNDSGDDTPTEASGEVFLEPISSTGANPFAPSVGTDMPDVAPPPGLATAGAQTFSGGTVGLYGGTRDNASCDRDRLVTYLDANPDKAQAWAETLGIGTSEIRSYVDGLTSVVLRADTRVTNHGYVNGRATEIPAVLQAGTAVLVDRYGTPVVKCFCGNPLTPAKTYAEPTYTGTRWTSFQPASVTVIVKNTVVVNTFTLVDPSTGQAFGRPAGSNGGSDGPAPEPTPGPSTSTTGPSGGASIDGDYTINFPAACELGAFDLAVNVRRTGPTALFTFTGPEGNASVTVRIESDLSFSGTGTATDGSAYTISGRFTPDGATMRLSGNLADASCSAGFDGRRD
jgi:hypothetical protein